MTTYLKRLFLAVALVLAVLLGAVYGLLGTNAGLQWAVRMGQSFVPGELHIGRVQGALLGDIQWQDVTYQQADGLQVSLQQAHWRWQPWRLLQHRFHIQSLSIQGLEVHVPPSQTTSEESPPFAIPELNIALPVSLVLEEGQLLDARIFNGDTEIPLAAVLLQARIDEQLHIERLMVASPLAALSVQGALNLTAPNAMQWRVDGWWPLPDALQVPVANTAATGTATLTGTLQAPELHHQLHQPVALVLDAKAQAVEHDLHWQADLSWDDVRWPMSVQKPALLHSRAGRLQANGDLQQAQLQQLSTQILQGQLEARGAVSWQSELKADVHVQAQGLELSPLWADWPAHLTLAPEIQVHVKGQAVTMDSVRVSIPELDQVLTAQGTAQLGDTPSFDLNMAWEHLVWPLQAPALFESAEGQAQVKGTADAYRLQMSTQVAGADIPLSHWQLRGEGSTQAFELHELKGRLLGGELALSGDVAWAPLVTWDLALKGKQLNPGQQWKEWPGMLDVAAHAQGRLQADGTPQAAVKLQHIQGRLRDYPLNMQADFWVDGADYQLKQLDFRSGSTHLQAQARFAQTLQAQWTLSAPDVQTVWPQASGSVQASGKVSGTLSQPQLQAQIQGQKMAFENFQLAQLDTQVRLDLGRKDSVFLLIDAKEAQQSGDVLVEQLKLQVEGRIPAHQWTMQLKTPQQAVDLQLQGGFDRVRQTWQGALQTGQVDLGELGQWQLAQAADVRLSAQQLSVAEMCWQAADMTPMPQVCVEAGWQAQGDSQIQARLKDLDVAAFQTLLPADLRFSSTVNAQLKAGLLANGQIRAQGEVSLSEGELRMILMDDWQRFPHQGGALTLAINEQGLDSQLDFKFLKNSQLQAQLQLPGFNQPSFNPEQVVQGRVEAQFKDFHLLPTLVPQIESAQGGVELNMDLQGAFNAPQLTGALSVKEVALQIPDLGLKLHDFNAQLTADGSSVLRLNSRLQSGQGELRSAGTLQLNSVTDWQADIKVQGEHLQAIDTADVRAQISPDLRIVAQPAKLHVTGTLHVPQADITPNIVFGSTGDTSNNTLPVVAVSADAVILQPDTLPVMGPPAPRGMNTQVDVLLSLGDDIRLDVAGFKSRLGGAVRVFLDPLQSVLRGNGAVYISQGVFRAYGQDLAIDQGFIIFNDGALDNPGLDIKAARDIYKDNNTPRVTQAGVHITGTAQNPTLALFSDSLVQDGQILSYIATGSALGNNSAGRSLSLGGYVRPNFYVSFGFSLFDNSRVFNLRYDLSEKWGVETSIGTKDSGMDISYTLGR